MQHLVEATRLAVKEKNWYAGLAMALTLPDICGRIEHPHLKDQSKARYVLWFDKYLASIYYGGFMGHVQMMKGGDLYALRCAYLHQGEFVLDGQKAKQLLDRFHISPPGPGVIHRNFSADLAPGTNLEDGKFINAVLQISVDKFCEEVCVAVETWVSDVSSDQRMKDEIEALGKMAQHGSIR